MWKCLEYSSWQTGICRRMLGYFKAFFLISLQIWKSRCPSVLSLTRTFTCLCFPAPCNYPCGFEDPQKAQHHVNSDASAFAWHWTVFSSTSFASLQQPGGASEQVLSPFSRRGHQTASNQLSIRKETRAQILRFLTTNCGSILQAESIICSTSPKNPNQRVKSNYVTCNPFHLS